MLLPGAMSLRSQVTDEDLFEEVLVYLRVQGVGGFDIDAFYYQQNGSLYLPVVDLFTFLKINQQATASYDKISGYFLDEKRLYEIRHTSKEVMMDGKVITLTEEEMVRTETGIYLQLPVFGKAFGLHCTFSFRAMSVELKTDLELPAIREMRLQLLRRNLEQLRGEIQVDTTLGRKYHLARFGMVDWAFTSTQISNQTTDNRISLATGMELLAGETNLYFNYSSRDGFDIRNQQYSWRWVSEENKFIRQVRLGKVGPGSISSIFNPMHGITITNASTKYRRSFGEYSITDYTEPGWTVELYVNNVLVDYKTADASGFYSFDIPLVYGSSEVMTKFYGPYGEERIKKQFINIPYHFLPSGEMEYTVTGGIIQDTTNSQYARASVNVGVSRFLSLGGGIEYLTALVRNREIPFASASVSPFRNLLITGEYAHSVRTKALLSYRLPSNIMLEVDYAQYDKEQEAISFNYLEERGATLNIPFHVLFLRGTARLAFKQNVYELLTYNTANATFSINIGPVNANLSGYASWIDERKPYIHSNIALSARLKNGFMIRPQMQYDFTNEEVVSVKAEVEKRIRRSAVVSMAYQNNIVGKYQSVEVTFRWDLPFAQSNLSARLSKMDMTTTQGARGSIVIGGGNHFIQAGNRSSIGRGAVAITPFIDINHNGIKDVGEPKANGVNVKMNGGRMLKMGHDSIIRVIELEPYTAYLMELDDASLDNIGWILPFKAIRVVVDPNQFKEIDIPIQPGAEISGMVYQITERHSLRGIGRILLNIHRSDGTFVAKIMTESDGYFTYLGLGPGDYLIQIDPEQLRRISMMGAPEKLAFTIQPNEMGDIIEDLEFFVKSISPK